MTPLGVEHEVSVNTREVKPRVQATLSRGETLGGGEGPRGPMEVKLEI